MMLVINIGTRPDSYRSNAMIDKWREYNSVSGGVHCCVHGCHAWATDGAHVTVAGRGRRQYIVPMCHKHNCQFGETMFVRDEASPAPLTSL